MTDSGSTETTLEIGCGPGCLVTLAAVALLVVVLLVLL